MPEVNKDREEANLRLTEYFRQIETKENKEFIGLVNELTKQQKGETYQDIGNAYAPLGSCGGGIGRTFNEYQDFVKTMKVYPEKHAIVYPALGIAGEGGEVAEKVKKWLRGDRELDKLELLKEAGDVLWYLASLADDLGFTFQDMVDENVKKLKSRKERGVQKGSGDNR